METGRAVIPRANSHVDYPARFQFIAAMNPCRCGHLEDLALACSRAPPCGLDYQARISGPLFDRINLRLDVPPVRAANLSLPSPAEGSAEIAARVAAAREIQRLRFTDQNIRVNAEADCTLLYEIAAPDDEGRTLITQAPIA